HTRPVSWGHPQPRSCSHSLRLPPLARPPQPGPQGARRALRAREPAEGPASARPAGGKFSTPGASGHRAASPRRSRREGAPSRGVARAAAAGGEAPLLPRLRASRTRQRVPLTRAPVKVPAALPIGPAASLPRLAGPGSLSRGAPARPRRRPLAGLGCHFTFPRRPAGARGGEGAGRRGARALALSAGRARARSLAGARSGAGRRGRGGAARRAGAGLAVSRSLPGARAGTLPAGARADGRAAAAAAAHGGGGSTSRTQGRRQRQPRAAGSAAGAGTAGRGGGAGGSKMSTEAQRVDDSPGTSGGSSDGDQRESVQQEPEREQVQPKKKEGKISSKTAAKLSTSAKRIQKELAEITLDPPPNCSSCPVWCCRFLGKPPDLEAGLMT
uniref:Ubiquitin conjugating enzyme E2 E2 n=1 Tax=Bos mutus grunniens TaxID=30521 RepID=A0A8B9X478_BOSMU